MRDESSDRLAVALSGGGHRATLFAVGSLMALVDRGLNRTIVQVASVSGGSIANAFVVQRCALEDLGPGELDPITRDLVHRIVTRGALCTRHIAALVVVLCLAGALTGVGLARVLPPSVGAAAGVTVALGGFLFAGRFVEWRLYRTFFHAGRSDGREPEPLPERLGDLAGRAVDHVFCASDLVLGNPVYFSTSSGGILWRRTQTLMAGAAVAGQRWAAGTLHLSDAVRASAAFPGIPPRRMLLDATANSPSPRRPSLLRQEIGDTWFGQPVTAERRAQLEAEENERSGRWPRYCVLADGGLWNNLGSQVIREDRFLGGQSLGSVSSLLCVDASAPIAPTHPLKFAVPGWSMAAWLMRSLQMLYENSVSPRTVAMRNALARRSQTLQQHSLVDPLDLVVDLTSTDQVSSELERIARHRYEIAASDPEELRWRSDIVEALKRWWFDIERGEPDGVPGRLVNVMTDFAMRQPGPKFSRVGVLDYDAVDGLTGTRGWEALETLARGDVDCPTTLGRVSPEMAKRLIARGYLNTWLMTLLLKQLESEEQDWLWRLADRIDTMVPAQREPLQPTAR